MTQIAFREERKQQRESTAYHEAGHVVTAYSFGRYPQASSIIPNNRGVVGTTEFDFDVPESAKRWFDNSEEKQRYIEMRVLITLAGSIAHDLREPGRIHDEGDSEDYQRARRIVEEAVSWDDDHRRYLERAVETTRSILVRHWLQVQIVAAALLDRDSLARHEICQLLGKPKLGSSGQTGR